MKNTFNVYYDDQPDDVVNRIESVLREFGITFKDITPDGSEVLTFEIVKDSSEETNGFIVELGHDSSSETGKFVKTYDEAVDLVHEFFLDYGFEIKDGKPFDPGHSEEGFEVFGDGPGEHQYPDWKIIEHNGEMKVIKFIHCDGDGPVGSFREND